MAAERSFEVEGYRLSADHLYDAATHLWVERSSDPRRVRIGFDPLGRETSGDIVQLSLRSLGTRVARGEPFGNLEAAKFVGPLTAPVSGVIVAQNQELLGNPGLANQDPERHWLVEFDLADPAELSQLLQGDRQVAPWFTAEVERFRRQGAVAE